MLVLVRVVGEVTVDESDQNVQYMLGQAIGDIDVGSQSIHPCYIRSQIGKVSSELAHDLLKDTLQRLEVLSLSQNCSNWHLVFSTTAVLLMVIELIQYQDARIGFHADLDGPLFTSPAFKFLARSQVLEDKGVAVLLHFYRICFGRCHARLADSSQPSLPKMTSNFLSKTRLIYNDMLWYLDGRSKTELANIRDMSDFFNRQVAKLFLLKPPIS